MGAWRPEPPVRYERFPKGRHWWLIAPFYLPQSSVFWRRELFERNGLFSEDLTYMFDGEFMCRLALAGEKSGADPGRGPLGPWRARGPEVGNPVALRAEIATSRTPGPAPDPVERLKLRSTLLLRRMGFYRAADEVNDTGVLVWVGTTDRSGAPVRRRPPRARPGADPSADSRAGPAKLVSV